MSSICQAEDADGSLVMALPLARQLKQRILSERQLTATIGIASNVPEEDSKSRANRRDRIGIPRGHNCSQHFPLLCPTTLFSILTRSPEPPGPQPLDNLVFVTATFGSFDVDCAIQFRWKTNLAAQNFLRFCMRLHGFFIKSENSRLTPFTFSPMMQK